MRPEPKEIPTPSPTENEAPAESSGSLKKLLYRDGNAAMNGWVNLLGLALVSAQFYLLLEVLEKFKLENEAFRGVMVIAFAGFIVHHLLPLEFRMSFFLALSVGTIAYVFGLEKGEWSWATSL